MEQLKGYIMKLGMIQIAKHITGISAHNLRNVHSRSLWQRCLVAIALLVTCALGVKAEQYVIYYQKNKNNIYYMANVGGTLTSTTTYDAATCVWEGTSGSTFLNNGKSIGFTAGNGLAVSLTDNNGQNLTIDATDKYLYYSSWTGNKYYIYYKADGFYNSPSNGDYGTTRVIVDTPPAANMGQDDVNAAKANIVVGVGYPKTTSEAYINLNNLTADTKTQAEVDALVTAYKTSPDIQLPEDGKAYQFTALFKDKKRYYMNYTAGAKMKVSDEVTASTFVCKELRTIDANTKVYAFVTEDGKVLTWIGNDESGAYKENDNIYGYSSNYATVYNGLSDWNEITVKKNDTHEEQFGLLRLVGRRHSTDFSSIIANTDKRFDQANDGNWFNETNTSAWILTEVEHTNTEEQELALAKIEAKEWVKNSAVPGTSVCQYLYTINDVSTTDTATIYVAIDAATTLAAVETITNSAVMNMPEVGKLYRIKGKVSGNYIDGVDCYSGTQMGMRSPDDWSDWGTVFYLDEGNRLQNLGTDTYVYNTREIGATYENADTWTFTESERTKGCVTLRSSYTNAAELHDNEGSRADRCNSICGIATPDRHDFILEEVHLVTPRPYFVLNENHGSFTMTCTMHEGVIYYITDGSDPMTSATRLELPKGQSVTFATGTIKAYAHRLGCEPSHVVTLSAKGVAIGTLEDLQAVSGTGFYYLSADIDASSLATSLPDFAGLLDGEHHTISGLTVPLFAGTNNATIKNVMFEEVNITGSTGDDVGTIVGTARGDTRIYNCGVLSGTVGGGNNVGGIAGRLNDEARVINCYSYADITGGTTVGGIVGYNSVASTASNLKTLVMNCMFYGNITGSNNISPVYNGRIISNAGSNGINNYNYYRYESPYSVNGKINTYNCALAAEERYLTRFEFYRNILNSQRKLCAYYVEDDVDAYEEIGKWVVDKKVAPYPIIKPWGKYSSTINKEPTDPDKEYQGKVLGELAVNIVGHGTVGVPITDMDTLNNDYNYYKVQLPYYNDYFNDNYTNGKVVTGWKITSISGGTAGTFSTSGDDRYNFADRYCTQKDLYAKTGIVFAQGGYYNVPEGVTGITIEPYWGKAVYLCDAGYDVMYTTGYSGTKFSLAGDTPDTFNGNQKVYKSVSNVWAQLDAGKTVYDNAIVLCGNYHSYNEKWNTGGKPFTIMSVDMDKDNEPDYCLYHHSDDRADINPVRFDFLCVPALGRAAKVNGSGMSMPNQGIYHPSGWFEITETSLMRFTEFEYDDGKSDAPLILNNGIFELFISSFNQSASNTIYMRLGGNVYFEGFTPGTHTDKTHSTKRSPLSITGGEYKGLYLSGEKSTAGTQVGNALCYSNGGFIHSFAGANMEDINGDVIVKMDHSIIKEFYGGGLKEPKDANSPQIKGKIDITINNSLVDFYCGGPKFGYVAQGKAVTTQATGTTFGEYYGAGYGGTSYTVIKQLLSGASGDPTGNAYNNSLYGKYNFKTETGDGILVNYHLDFFSYAGGTGNLVSRFFNHYAKLSLAQTNNVTSTLTDCIIKGNFYGGGCQGAVNGTVVSTLIDCEVGGNAFGGGFSASVPTCMVRPSVPDGVPTYNQNTGVFNKNVLPPYETYLWSSAVNAIDENARLLPTTAEMLENLGTVDGKTFIDVKGKSHIAGSVFGGGNMSKVNGQTEVIINGAGVVVGGSVFGGGNEALVDGNTHVHVKSGTIEGNVFGAGNRALVTGATDVVIGGGE